MYHIYSNDFRKIRRCESRKTVSHASVFRTSAGSLRQFYGQFIRVSQVCAVNMLTRGDLPNHIIIPEAHDMKKIAKTVRVLTVAPAMALVMLAVLFVNRPEIFGSTLSFILSIVFMVVFPLLGYPLQPLFKKFREMGREGQRTLAMIFANVGYVLGCVCAFLLHAPKGYLVIYLSYLASVILIVVFNKLFHVKASGHACGVAGPFALLVYFGQPIGYIGIPIFAAVCWASLKMKRHTPVQLVCGALISLLSLLIVALILNHIS